MSTQTKETSDRKSIDTYICKIISDVQGLVCPRTGGGIEVTDGIEVGFGSRERVVELEGHRKGY